MYQGDVEYPTAFIYEICASDRIVAVSAPGQTSESPLLNRRLWDLLPNGNLSDIYQALLRRVREGGRAVSFHFRCDEPETRRLLRMTLEPLPKGSVRFISQPLEAEPQSPAEFFHRHRLPPADVDICTICGAIKAAGLWMEPDRALESLGVFSEDLDFRTWPCTCSSCRAADH